MELNLPEQMDVLVVLGSISDKHIAGQMQPVFSEFDVAAQFTVCSAQRDHERLAGLIPAAEAAGALVFIAVAGKAAHLPGVIAAMTTRPVIGVPVESGMLGMDALLSIAQMPPGIPVAGVGVDAGKNAALLAIEILATGARPGLGEKLQSYRASLREQNRGHDTQLRDSLETDK